MNTLTRGNKKPPGSGESITLSSVILRLLGLMLFWAGGSWLMLNMWADGYWQLAGIILLVSVMLTVIWLHPKAYPMRWMSPGLSFMLLVSLYPILYTVYISFTNFGTGHILPKNQAIEVLADRRFLPEEGAVFEYTLYTSASGGYALLLADDAGKTPTVIIPGEMAELADLPTPGDAPPEQINLVGASDPYTRVPTNRLITVLTEIQDVDFGSGDISVRVTGLKTAAALEPQFVYDPETDTVYDQKAEVRYRANDEEGMFIAQDGTELTPGYTVTVGTLNYVRFAGNPAFRGPLLQIFIWTIIYALAATVISFSLGLLIAIAFGRDLPGQRIIKSLLIVPFAIPGVISILVWRGLWNPISGPVALMLSNVFGQTINVFADPIWVKIALITINVWLAYPYYILINSGALQAIPSDLYEAAEIDGASPWHQFTNITLPLLLVGVGPLIIGSFMVNFNSFNNVFLFNDGGPPMVGTPTPAGHSDILISYVYRLAFGGGGQDFGYATAITMVIFVLLVGMTLIQYRYMRVWEQVGENV
ncbi:MAG: ABC transporter permease subunit [Anaerolineales bacterium]|nr:ABC transporter permease subunit [Anaerolineales bacterium]